MSTARSFRFLMMAVLVLCTSACASTRGYRIGNDYVIDRKVNLRGGILDLPEGCNLVFKGKGMILNGTVVGKHTRILADKRLIMENVTIAKRGTWKTGRSYPEWFGASDNKSIDSKMAIQKAIDVADTCVLSQTYYTSYNTQTNRGDAVSICAIEIANTVLIGEGGNKILINAGHANTEKTSVFWVGDNVTIDGINIEYYNTEYTGWTGVQAGVYRVQGGNVTIQNTSLRGAMAAWINIQGKTGRSGFIIRNNYVHDCDCGVIIQGDNHKDGVIYPLNLEVLNNTIEKEQVRHSEFISFWGCCKDGGKVYYTNVSIKNNTFRGGWQGGCITGNPKDNGLRDVVISDNQFDDCGACSFYNTDGLTYIRNYVTRSSFIERQVKGINGSYPHLNFTNCKNCIIDDISCFGLSFDNCQNIKIGKIKQTLCIEEDDPYFLQKPVYVTNFIGIKAKNSTVTIDELTINPVAKETASTDACRYYVNQTSGSNIKISKTVSTIPIQMSAKGVSMKNRQFKMNKNIQTQYIDTTK